MLCRLGTALAVSFFDLCSLSFPSKFLEWTCCLESNDVVLLLYVDGFAFMGSRASRDRWKPRNQVTSHGQRENGIFVSDVICWWPTSRKWHIIQNNTNPFPLMKAGVILRLGGFVVEVDHLVETAPWETKMPASVWNPVCFGAVSPPRIKLRRNGKINWKIWWLSWSLRGNWIWPKRQKGNVHPMTWRSCW